MAKKKARLSNVEEFYVGHNPANMSQQELAQKFDTTILVVSNIQKKYKEEAETKLELEQKESEVIEQPKTILNELMTGKSDSNKNNITVMGQAASERCDSIRDYNKSTKKANTYNNNHTAKPFPNRKD